MLKIESLDQLEVVSIMFSVFGSTSLEINSQWSSPICNVHTIEFSPEQPPITQVVYPPKGDLLFITFILTKLPSSTNRLLTKLMTRLILDLDLL